MKNKFSNSVIEQIGHYVYCLIDPRNKQVFYIGRGQNSRVFDHMNATIKEKVDDSDKLKKIGEIKEAGLQLEHSIIRHGLTEQEAIETEAALIDLATLCENKELKLTNLYNGFHTERGERTVEEIEQFYKAEIINEITEPALIIFVNKLYKRGMTDKEIYEITHEKWRINKSKSDQVEYVLASFKGIVRGVYKVKEWYDTDLEERKQKRRGFKGEQASEDIRQKYLGKSLVNFPSGGTPFRYCNI